MTSARGRLATIGVFVALCVSGAAWEQVIELLNAQGAGYLPWRRRITKP